MTGFLRWIALPLAMAVSGCAGQPRASLSVPSAAVAFDGAWHATMKKAGFSGVAVRGKRCADVKGAATGNALPGSPMRLDTPVDMMSIAKVVTGMAILVLVEDGALSLDQPLAELLPQAPADKAAITVRQLMVHRAGIVDVAGNRQDYDVVALPAYVEEVLASPLEFTPGAQYSYSNGGYGILAAIVERRSGKSFADFVETRIARPAGVSLGLLPPPQAVAAGGRDHFSSEILPIDPKVIARERGGPFGVLTGAGGLYATARDVICLTHAWMDGKIANGTIVSLGNQPAYEAGAGRRATLLWDVQPGAEGLVLFHGGDSTYARAELRYSPATRDAMFVWGNSISPSGHRMRRALDREEAPTETLLLRKAGDTPATAGLRSYFQALASEDAVGRRRFLESETTAGFFGREKSMAAALERMGRHWWSLGSPALLSLEQDATRATALVELRESTETRRYRIAAEVSERGLLSSLKISPAD